MYVGDVAYFGFARSIVDHRTCRYNFARETMLPPGFPLILAAVWVTVGNSYVIFVRAALLFTALGFMASYELLRRQQDRAFAAVACLLLCLSQLIFSLGDSNHLLLGAGRRSGAGFTGTPAGRSPDRFAGARRRNPRQRSRKCQGHNGHRRNDPRDNGTSRHRLCLRLRRGKWIGYQPELL